MRRLNLIGLIIIALLISCEDKDEIEIFNQNTFSQE